MFAVVAGSAQRHEVVEFVCPTLAPMELVVDRKLQIQLVHGDAENQRDFFIREITTQLTTSGTQNKTIGVELLALTIAPATTLTIPANDIRP